MKTYQIKDLLKKDLLVVELPKWYRIINYQKPLLEARGNEPHLVESLSLDEYELLGKPDEIKEEDVKDLVQYLTRRDSTITPKNYLEGKDGRFEVITFTESLLSAIESEIYWDVNPEGKFPRYAFDENINPKDIKARAYHQKWHEAQSRTFDRNRTLIFVKN